MVYNDHTFNSKWDRLATGSPVLSQTGQVQIVQCPQTKPVHFFAAPFDLYMCRVILASFISDPCFYHTVISHIVKQIVI